MGYKPKKLLENDAAEQLMFGKVQPQAIDLEEAVIGAAMLDKEAMPIIVEILRPDSFYVDAHQEIYRAMTHLYEVMKPIDILTVKEALNKTGKLEEIGGINYLMELTEKVASAANIEYHSRIIIQKFIQRELIKISTSTIHEAFEDRLDVLEMLDKAEQALFDITDKNLNTGYQAISALLTKVQDDIKTVSEQEDGITGVSTGFKELDKLTSGWQPSDLIIIAARPGMGKTAFTLSLAKNAAENGVGVAVFSLEMGDTQLTQRLISMEAEISSSNLRNGKLGDHEWPLLERAVNKLGTYPIFIDDTPAINIFELRAKCRRLKQNHGIGLVIIDYLQLMSGNPNGGRSNREQEISMISRSLKGLAKEMQVPVIALSQLSRAVETRGGDKRPQLSDLRESGAIEQDADIVTFIYRAGYYALSDGLEVPENEAEIIVAKHRNGATDTVKLSFIPEYVTFKEPQDNMFTGFDAVGGNDNPFDGSITLQSKLNPDETEFF